MMRKLRVCHGNVRSLCAATRLLNLELLCAAQDIDVLCVTET